MTIPEFKPFPKLPRLNRDIIITEKIDGTNAQILITDDGQIFAGSRSRYVTPENDNYGFARWVQDNKEELLKLGPGQHFGEWWGAGIQRRYGLNEKRFSLFNTQRWQQKDGLGNPGILERLSVNVGGSVAYQCGPACCFVVPILYRGPLSMNAIDHALTVLRINGSMASPGFQLPEGIVVYHTAGQVAFKVTLENDDTPKGQVCSA